MSKICVQYGCGLSAPSEWLNFDASPTLKIQRIPIIGRMLRGRLNVVFSDNVKFGDIVKGLPVAGNSCDMVYCSHVLEHLSLSDFRKAIRNTYGIIKPGGVFCCIVPDLESYARDYVSALDARMKNPGRDSPSVLFLKKTLLGVEVRPRGVKSLLTSVLGNSHHFWMWDAHSLAAELAAHGFTDIVRIHFNDCATDEMLSKVADPGRFEHSIAFRCEK